MSRKAIKLIKNIKLLNEITFNASNYNYEKDSYDNVSPNNHIYILSLMIFNHLNDIKVEYNREMIVNMATEYDLSHLHEDKSGFRSKEYIFDNTINFEFHHHRDILLEELYSNVYFITDTLGFDPKIVNVIKFHFLQNRFFIYHNYLKNFPKQVSSFFDIVSCNIYDLTGKSIEEIKYHIQDYPIIRMGDYYCLSSMVNLNMNYRRIINFHLKDSQNFKKHKGKKFEDAVFKLIDFYSKGSVYCDVRFQKYQSDIVLEDEDAIYVFECKAIDLYDDYKRNKDTIFIEQNMNAILDDTIVQGERFFKNVDNNFEFNTLQGKKIFSKQKDKYIVSVSMESFFGESRTSRYKFINLSFSDLATILETSNAGLYETSNYNYGFDAIKDMVLTKLDIDNTVNFLILLTMDKKLIEIAKKTDTTFDIGFKVLNDYDHALSAMMYDIERAEEAKELLIKNNEWMSLYVSKEKNELRRTIKD